MSAPPYLKFYVADYLGDTNHLTTLEHGTYILLLFAMFRHGGSLPAADANLAKIAKLTPEQWAGVREDILPLFQRARGRITQKRLAREMAKYEDVSRHRSKAGKQGAAQKASKNNTSTTDFAEQTDSNCRHNQNQNQKKIEDADASLSSEADVARSRQYPEPFDAAWKAYPHVKGRSSKIKAFGVWRRLPAPAKLVLPLAVDRYAHEGREPKQDCGAPAMERWLREERYEDWLAAEPSAAKAPVDDDAIWRRRVGEFSRNQHWNTLDWGPKPGKPGCLVAAAILREHGIEPPAPELKLVGSG